MCKHASCFNNDCETRLELFQVLRQEKAKKTRSENSINFIVFSIRFFKNSTTTFIRKVNFLWNFRKENFLLIKQYLLFPQQRTNRHVDGISMRTLTISLEETFTCQRDLSFTLTGYKSIKSLLYSIEVLKILLKMNARLNSVWEALGKVSDETCLFNMSSAFVKQTILHGNNILLCSLR